MFLGLTGNAIIYIPIPIICPMVTYESQFDYDITDYCDNSLESFTYAINQNCFPWTSTPVSMRTLSISSHSTLLDSAQRATNKVGLSRKRYGVQ